MKNILFALLSIAIISGCDKDPINPTEPKIYFKGITITDIQGIIISEDTSDWTTNDTWSIKEGNLFSTTYYLGCLPQHNNKIIGYPNPGDGVFALHIQKDSSTRIEFRLVDENFNTLITHDSIYQNNIALDARTFGIQDTVRLYYKFIENNCEFRGHGDILIR